MSGTVWVSRVHLNESNRAGSRNGISFLVHLPRSVVAYYLHRYPSPSACGIRAFMSTLASDFRVTIGTMCLIRITVLIIALKLLVTACDSNSNEYIRHMLHHDLAFCVH